MSSMNTNAKEKILSFAKDNKNIYIYGAGKYGGLCLEILQADGIIVTGFIETSPRKKLKNGIVVHKMASIISDLTEKDAIIIAAKKEYCVEMVSHIPDYIHRCCLDDDEWSSLFSECFFTEIKNISEELPFWPLSNPKEWQRILIVRLDVIGDMVWTTSFLRELRRYCCNAEISMVIRPEIYELMKNCPYIDRIVCFDCSVPSVRIDYDNMRKEAQAFVEQYFEREKFDVVFLPRTMSDSNLLENLYIAVYSGARQRVGVVDSKASDKFFNCMKGLFSVLVKARPLEHEVDRVLKMLYACKIAVNDKKLELWPSSVSLVQIDDYLKNRIGVKRINIVLVSVGLMSRDGNRTWPAEKYVQLIDEVSRYNHRVIFVLCGGNDAKESALKFKNRKSCIDFTGQLSLDETAALLGQCDFYLGANTGLLHIAAAMNKPVIEISGQWDGGNDDSALSPARVGAYGVPAIVLRPEKAADEECAKAGWCKKSVPHCISQITVREVKLALEAMIQILDK